MRNGENVNEFSKMQGNENKEIPERLNGDERTWMEVGD